MIETLLHAPLQFISMRKKLVRHPFFRENLPARCYYIVLLARIYPFARLASDYIKIWAQELSSRYADPFLIQIAQEAANDEEGHAELIAKDLEALGISPERSLQELRSKNIEIWMEFFTDSVRKDPLHFLSWLYFTEKMTSQVTPEFLSFWKEELAPCRALRFYTVHSSTGLDAEHIAKREGWIKALAPSYQVTVLQELYWIASRLPPPELDIDPDLVLGLLLESRFVVEDIV